MSEIINAYLNTTNYIVSDVVYNIIVIVVGIAVVLFLISASRASIGGSDIKVLVFATVCIIFAVDDDGKETKLSKEHAISDLKGE